MRRVVGEGSLRIRFIVGDLELNFGVAILAEWQCVKMKVFPDLCYSNASRYKLALMMKGNGKAMGMASYDVDRQLKLDDKKAISNTC